MEHLQIRQVLPLNKGEWYISYTALAPCGCRIERNKLKMYQAKKPTDKQIEKRILDKQSK